MPTSFQRQILLILFAFESCQGVIQFTTHPTNQTVNYGDFVTFECRLQVDDRSHILLSYIGNTNVQNDRSSLADLDRREFSANVSGTVGRVSMLINSRTLELFDNFWCRAVYVQHQHIDSAVAYINVKYPECNALQSQPSLAVTAQPLSVATSTASTPQDVKPTCTCDPIGSNEELKVGTNHQAVFYYQIAFGVCLSLIVVMLIVLAVIAVRIWVVHRIRIREKASMDSAGRICNSLVRNPIYDGPVYESVEPRFATPTKIPLKPSLDLNATLTTPTSSGSADNTSDHDQISLLDNSNDGTRYVCKPRRLSVPILNSGVPFPYISPRECRRSRDDFHKRTSTSTDENSLAVPPTRLTKLDSTEKGIAINTSFQDKEDPYTLMSPAGTLAASLTGGWGKFDQKVNNQE